MIWFAFWYKKKPYIITSSSIHGILYFLGSPWIFLGGPAQSLELVEPFLNNSFILLDRWVTQNSIETSCLPKILLTLFLQKLYDRFYESCQHRKLSLYATATKTKSKELLCYYFDHTKDSAIRVFIFLFITDKFTKFRECDSWQTLPTRQKECVMFVMS